MIAELTADLLALVRTVPALAAMTSLTIGGKAADPGLVKVPLPACWITFGKDVSDERSYEHGPESGLVIESPLMIGTWAVTVFVPYDDDDDLLTVQLPMLESIVIAVHARETPSGFNWRFAGQRMVQVYPDRLAYEQHYTANYALARN